LLTFEIELVKANAPIKEAADIDTKATETKQEVVDAKMDIR
jgi:hypothetical protein